MKQRQTSYEFGPYLLDIAERQLLRSGIPLPLAPKVFDTLVVLVENYGKLLSKDALMCTLWPDSFVEEATLARNVSDLRKALGEGSGNDKYIETVPKVGYRFVSQVKSSAETNSTLIVHRRTKSRVTVEEIGEDQSVRSIAVLPFKQFTAGAMDDYLDLGLA